MLERHASIYVCVYIYYGVCQIMSDVCHLCHILRAFSLACFKRLSAGRFPQDSPDSSRTWQLLGLGSHWWHERLPAEGAICHLPLHGERWHHHGVGSGVSQSAGAVKLKGLGEYGHDMSWLGPAISDHKGCFKYGDISCWLRRCWDVILSLFEIYSGEN